MTEKNASGQANGENSLNDGLRSEILAEYSSLRNEMLQRIDMRQQILTFTLVIAGVILTIGLEAKVNVVLLVYPILALFFANAWAQHDHRIGEIGRYLRDEVESSLDGVNWEKYISGIYKGKKFRLVEFYAQGLFFGMAFLAVLLALVNFTFSSSEYILLVADGVAIILIYLVTRRRRKTFRTDNGK